MARNATGRKRDPKVRIAGFLKRSAVNGPGLRSVIWTQGCPIRCEECFNPALWDEDGGHEAGIDQLLHDILATEGIDGITLSGGEPFFQADPLADLAEGVRSHDLSVLTFSGYPYDILTRSENRSWHRLLCETDLLVSGPYQGKKARNSPAAQSLFKEIHDLTGRIDYRFWTPQPLPLVAEYAITSEGTITITGYPEPCLTDRFCALGRPGGE